MSRGRALQTVRFAPERIPKGAGVCIVPGAVEARMTSRVNSMAVTRDGDGLYRA